MSAQDGNLPPPPSDAPPPPPAADSASPADSNPDEAPTSVPPPKQPPVAPPASTKPKRLSGAPTPPPASSKPPSPGTGTEPAGPPVPPPASSKPKRLSMSEPPVPPPASTKPKRLSVSDPPVAPPASTKPKRLSMSGAPPVAPPASTKPKRLSAVVEPNQANIGATAGMNGPAAAPPNGTPNGTTDARPPELAKPVNPAVSAIQKRERHRRKSSWTEAGSGFGPNAENTKFMFPDGIATDSHIYNTPDTSDTIIFFSTGNEVCIRAGTIEKLISMLTHPMFRDPEFEFCFLATFPSFISPEDLIKLLELRFQALPPEGLTDFAREQYNQTAYVIRQRVVDVLCQWVEQFSPDFAKSLSALETLEKLINSELFDLLPGGKDKVEKVIKQQITKRPTGEMTNEPVAAPQPQTEGSKRPAYTAESMARALCFMEERLFYSIEPRELLDCAWNSKHKEQLAPNVLSMIRNSTHISYFVAGEILRESKLKKRTQLLQLFITTAGLCRDAENFNAVVEIIAGLSTPGVHRLEKTWNSLPQKSLVLFDDLLALTTENNYALIRECMDQTASCIPYLGVFLTDLTFITEANPKLLSSRVELFLVLPDKTKHLCEFDGRQKVQKVYDKMMELVDEETRNNKKHLMLRIVPKKGEGIGQFLNNEKRLYEYEIYRKDKITLARNTRVLEYNVTGGLQGKTRVHQNDTVRSILDTLSLRLGIPQGLFVLEAEGRVLDHDHTLWEQDLDEDVMVSVKGAAVDLARLKEYKDSARLMEILFTEHSHSIINGSMPVTEEVALELCLLHLQSLYGRGLQPSSDGKTVVKVASIDDLGEKPLLPSEVEQWLPHRVSEVEYQLKQLGISPSELEDDFDVKKHTLMDALQKIHDELPSEEEALKTLKIKEEEQAEGKKPKKKKGGPVEKSVEFVDYLPAELRDAVARDKKESVALQKGLVTLFPRLPQGAYRPRLNARARYIELVKSQPTYGGEFFRAEKVCIVKKKEKLQPVFAGVIDFRLVLVDASTKAEVDSLHLRETQFLQVRKEGDALVYSKKGETLLTLVIKNTSELPKLYKIIVNSIRFVEKKVMPSVNQNEVDDELHEGESHYVNFSKCLRTGRIVKRILNFQTISPIASVDPGLLNYIRTTRDITEDEQYEMSLALEPQT